MFLTTSYQLCASAFVANMLTYRPLLGLEASAGSGKTFALSVHFAYLLLTDKTLRPNEILALTFTKKAAKEMRQKILYALFLLSQNCLSADDKKQKDDFVKTLSDYANTSEGKIIQNGKDLYARALSNKPSVMTFDAFFMSVLKKFCWYAGVPSDFEIDTLDFTNQLYEHFLGNLKQPQRQLLADLCLQNQWVGIHDCQSFFDNLLQFSLQSPEILSPNPSVGKSKWREHLNALQAAMMQFPLSKSAQNALEAANFYELLDKTWLQRESLQDYRYFAKLPHNPQLQNLFETLKNDIRIELEHSENQTFQRICSLFSVFDTTLAQWQKHTHKLQIRDIALKTHNLLCGKAGQKINMDFLYFRLDSKITHLLLDEFQDTNIVQFQILKPLIDEIISGHSRKENRSFFYVGDIKQSIYQFRGSSPELFGFLAQSKQIPLAKLDKNWRSRKEIVEFVNEIFAPIYPHYSLQEPQKEGGFVQVCFGTDTDTIVKNVLECVQNLFALQVAPEDIAILGFYHKDLLHIQNALAKKFPQIPIAKETSSKIATHPEVQALYAALRFYHCAHILDKRQFFALQGIACDDSLEHLFEQLTNNLANQPETEPDAQPQLRPATLLKELMQTYQLASVQAQKFLEIAISHHSIASFLKWAKNDSESKNGQQHSEALKGIRTLTIHSAKGLEFAHTIVIDTFSKGQTDSDKILFDYDIANEKGQLFIKEKNKEYFSQSYQQAKERKQLSNELQARNLLYVAFTRAKDSLHVFALDNHSAFEKLNLKAMQRGEIQTMPPSAPQKLPQSKQIVQQDYGRQTRFLRHSNAVMSDDAQSANFGNALHFALELALKFSLPIRTIQSMLQQHYGYLLPPQTLAEVVTKCNNFLKNKDFLEILSKGELQCEVSFLKNNRIYRVDLLVIGKNEVVVVDYKSGNPNKEEYLRQIQDYKTIVRAYYQMPVRGYLLTNMGLKAI